MRAFFDTSVLLAALHGDHEHHTGSLDSFLEYSRRDAVAGAHSLAELYATLTAFPGRRRVAPDQALLLLEGLRQRLTWIALSEDEYWKTINETAERGIVGGAVYDALLARCALKARAEVIFTLNARDFERLGPEIAKRLRTP